MNYIIFLLELLKYSIGLYVCFDEKRNKIYIDVIGLLLYGFFVNVSNL